MRPATLVTGAGGGIGAAVCDRIARHADVIRVDLELPDVRSSAALSIQADVTNPAALHAVAETIEHRYGRLDGVVCGAGIIRDRVSWKMTDAQWQDVIDVNLTGAFNTARAAIPLLRRTKGGRIVFIGSINGTRGRFGQANYAASKAGLVGLARSLALELARDGITVNVVTPGFIDTAMTRSLSSDRRQQAVERTPLQRVGDPCDIAAAVQFLLSRDAGFITGAVLPVDGGQLLGEVA